MTHDQDACCDSLFSLLVTRGHGHYDEDVSQLDHARQAASLAEADGAPDELVVAALLHDIGHLLLGDALGTAAGDVDLEHEKVGARFLGRLFGPGVAGPVALHVIAKRFLVTVDTDYAGRLSDASVQSLRLQGGALPPADVAHFTQLPYSDAAVRLRQWDDRAKVPNAPTPDLNHWRPAMRRLLRPPSD